MKIIFLDFDGVLNSENWMVSRFKKFDNDDIATQYPFYEIEPDAVENLNRIIELTGAKVVVSSTWRHGRTPEELLNILKFHNFKGEIIDVTPSLNIKGYTVPRGCEIDFWLKEKNFRRINWSVKSQLEVLEKSEVKNYVILDDDSDMLLCQRDNFVKTSWKSGLDSEKTDDAIRILNTPIENLYFNI